jgi:hypothetical protein
MKSSLPWSLSYFTKSTFIEGIAGEPGSIRLIKPGPGITTQVLFNANGKATV